MSQSKRTGKWVGILLLGVLLAGLLSGLLSGCDDARYDYNPPPGMGALIIENYTGDRVRVYIDGNQTNSVSSGGQGVLDVLPGVRRVAVDSEDILRSWAGDVDLLEGRRTIMELRGNTVRYEAFDVTLYFD
jgi:hypothetical protein